MPNQLNTDEIVIAGNGAVRVAPKGTTFPVSPVATPGSAWVNLGYLDEDGVDLTAGADWEEIMAWQSIFPVRRVASSRSLELEMKLHQWNRDTVPFAFGGGQVVELSTGIYKYEPPEPEYVDERQMIVDWSDGSKHYRWCIRKGMISDDVETSLVRSDSGKLSLTFSINGEANVKPWYLLTDDPAFNPAA